MLLNFRLENSLYIYLPTLHYEKDTTQGQFLSEF